MVKDSDDGREYYIDNPNQLTVLRGLYISLEVLFVATLCFWIFNVVRYIYPMKERSKLILLYYILSFIVLSCQIPYYITRIIYPWKDPFIFNGEGFNWDDGLECIASSTLVALGWLVCATMYQLKTSIRIIYKILDANKAPCKLKAMNIYAATMTAVQLLGLFVFPIAVPTRNSNLVSWVYIFSYVTLCVSYTVVIVQLQNVLKSMKQHLKKEYWKIMFQFILFDFAYFSEIVLQMLFFLGERYFNWHHYIYTIFQGTFHVFFCIIPISYMLYSHHSTFSKQLRANEEEIETNQPNETNSAAEYDDSGAIKTNA